MLYNKKFIFVCYYSGSGGRMVAELCKLILNPNLTPSDIFPSGEIITVNALEILLSKKGTDLYNKEVYNNDDYELFTTIVNEWLTDSTISTNNVVSSHLLNVKLLSTIFPESKFIIIVPQSIDEFEFAKKLWVYKNQQNKYQKISQSNTDFLEIALNWKFFSYTLHNECIDTNKFLFLSISDIFDDTKMVQTVGMIDNFIVQKMMLRNNIAIEVRKQELLLVLDYYKKYLELNKNNL